MEPTQVLGAYDDNSQPKTPIYALGKVIERGKDIGREKNHADYTYDNGEYDLVGFFTDFRRFYPALFAVMLGQLTPHVTSEVDCEPLNLCSVRQAFCQILDMLNQTFTNTRG